MMFSNFRTDPAGHYPAGSATPDSNRPPSTRDEHQDTTMLQRRPTHRAARTRTAVLLGRLALAAASLSVIYWLANAYLNR